MDESVKSDSRLDVSVSFGRFENDALSWEKWSSFSPNKYLEEVGSLSTPGSVAQKKAYFEAHYKKIAAKKAEEELEQENSPGLFSPSPDTSSEVDSSAYSSEPVIKFDLSDCEKLVEETVTVKTNVDVVNEAKCGNNDRLNGFVDVINSDEEKEDVNSAVVQCESSETEKIKDESSVSVNGPGLYVVNDSAPIVLETPKKGYRDIVEKWAVRKNVKEIVTVKTNVDVVNQAKCDNNDRLNGFVDVINSEEEKEDVNSAAVKCESSETEKTKDESSVSVNGPGLYVGNDSAPIVLETPKKGYRDIVEKRAVRKNVKEFVTVKTNVDVVNQAKCDNNDRLNGFVDVINSDEEKDDVNSADVKCESSEIGKVKDGSSVGVNGPGLHVGNDSEPVVLEIPKKISLDIVEKRAVRKNVKEQETSVLKKENSKSSGRIITQRVTPFKKEKSSVTVKKKTATPVTKPLQAATSRYTKPALTSTASSASRALNKSMNGPQLQKSNDLSARESSQATPTSLHMSLSLGPTNSLGGLSTTRKSLIMESMGDKDIVKRAFKTFQNRTISGSMGDEKTSAVKHVASTALEPNVSSFHTPTKGNIRPRNSTEKMATPRSHPGAKSNPLPSGSHKGSAMGRKNTMAVSPHTVLKNDEKSEKRKEFLKKLEAKSIAREAANAQLSAKSRAGIANEMHQRPALSR